jgi:hypothetical protein
VPDEAVTDDEDAATWHALRTAQHAGEWLGHRSARVVDAGRQIDPALRPRALREAARPDRGRRERGAERLVPCAAWRALAAGRVVDERDPPPVPELSDDLVSKHLSRTSGVAELLHVGAAQAAREDTHQLAGAVRLRDLGELRLAVRP